MKHQIKILYPGSVGFLTSVETSKNTHSHILEVVFAQWNGGSNEECPQFLTARCRSLSVGDFVQIDDGPWYLCEGFGWAAVPPEFLALRQEKVADLMAHPQKMNCRGFGGDEMSALAFGANNQIVFEERRRSNT